MINSDPKKQNPVREVNGSGVEKKTEGSQTDNETPARAQRSSGRSIEVLIFKNHKAILAFDTNSEIWSEEESRLP